MQILIIFDIDLKLKLINDVKINRFTGGICLFCRLESQVNLIVALLHVVLYYEL